EFRRLSFLLGWSLLSFFRLPPRTRFSTLAPKRFARSGGSTISELSLFPRQQAAGSIVRTPPQTRYPWMLSSTLSLSFPAPPRGSLSPMQRKEPNQALQRIASKPATDVLHGCHPPDGC